MLRHERYQFILDKLQNEQKVDAAGLSLALNISEATARRDLTDLADLGKIHKVHGGAVLAAHPTVSFQQRIHVDEAKKLKIARKASLLLKPGQVIAIDGGTTNLQLVKLIPVGFPATIVTNSPTIAQQFNMHTQVDVILSGGAYFKYADVVVGAQACRTFQEIYADICLLGVCSIHHAYGVTNGYREETQVKQAMVQSASQVVALVSAEKLETRDHYKVCDTNMIATLVTDLEPNHEQLNIYQKNSINVL